MLVRYSVSSFIRTIPSALDFHQICTIDARGLFRVGITAGEDFHLALKTACYLRQI